MDTEYEGCFDIEQAWREGLTPDPLLSVSEWSDRHRMLSSKASAEPGRWRTSRTPYLKAIMDCLSPTSPVERVVFMKAAQLGATEMGNNWIGYVIHHAPGPMMAVSPTVEMAKRNSKQRIDPLIEESPVLAELIAPSRSRDAGNTILAKEFRGGVLVMTGANSAVGLRSMPVRYLFLDEVDGYPNDVDGEGDAISLAEARTRTFARRKIFIVSTPTIAGASAIEREYEASDQRRYFLPCPHCAHRQWLRFEQLRWEKGRPETAAYQCEACELSISEQHKTWMLEHGKWRSMMDGDDQLPEVSGIKAEPKTAGFHLSSLYSPVGWRSWRNIAAAWESAINKESGSASAIKTFKNTELGETWVEEGEAPDWQRLIERREDYKIGSVPGGGLLLVGGADIQKDRIEASIWAFGRGKESWLIEHRVLMGDSARDEVWKSLASLVAETWTHESGAQLPLARFAIDTGFATQEAYAFIRRLRDSRVMAVKGVAKGAALIGTPTAVDVSQGGKKLRRGIKVFSVVVSIAKLEFYNNLRKAADVLDDGVTLQYPIGFVHLPKVDGEFVQQLCAEQLMTRRNRHGFAVREWHKMRERNEALDCYVYARAAACAAGLDRFEERHWQELERQLGVPDGKPPPIPTANANTAVLPAEPQTEATHRGGLSVSGTNPTGRRVIRSRWIN
ncbi:MAG: terminase [Methylomonas sp.]|nr:MAG: terminase [Methylomonas sp.]